MVIEKINVKSFGLLTDTSLDFSDSVNVLEGENEAGKSTIAAFIKYMLFGFDTTDKPGQIAERTRRINWETGAAEGSMIVRVRGRKYLINRSCIRTERDGRVAYKEDCSIVDLETGAPAFGKAPAGEVFFGVNKELFENTAFIGSLTETGIDGDAVSDSIENILFSGSEKQNISRAIEKITDKMETLLHKSGTGGAIYDLQGKEADLKEKLRRTNESNREIMDKEAKLHDLRRGKEQTAEQLDKLVDLDRCYKNVMVIQSFDKLHELEKECETKGEALSSFLEQNTKNDFYPSENYLADLALTRQANGDAYRAYTAAEERLASVKKTVGISDDVAAALDRSEAMGAEANLKTQAAALRSGKIRSFVFASLCLVLLLGATVYELIADGLWANILPRAVFGLIGLGGAILSVIFAVKGKRRSSVLAGLCRDFDVPDAAELQKKLDFLAISRAKRDALIAQTQAAEAERTEASDRYDATRKNLIELILRWGAEPPETALSDFLDTLQEQIKAFLAEKGRLEKEKENLELTVKEIRRSLADKSEIDIRAKVPPLKRKVLSEINHDEIVRGISRKNDDLKSFDTKIEQMEAELTDLKLRARDPAELITKIALLEEQIKKLTLTHKAYALAHHTLEEASAALREEISPRLGAYAASLLGTMTNRKYKALRVTNGIRVTYTDTDGEERIADFLSGGTKDLTYISVRMALIDMLYTERPPVVFDESFAHQDDNRARSMMEGIKHLCVKEKQQCFIFTCRTRESSLAAKAVKNAAIFRLTRQNTD